MKKFIFFLITLIFIFKFFSCPAFAYTPQSDSNWFKDVWDNISSTFTGIFNSYIAPKFTIQPENDTVDTDYNSSNKKGIAKRAIPIAMDESMKIKYVESFIDGDFKDNPKIATCNSTDIFLKDLIFYKLNNNSLPLSPDQKAKFLADNPDLKQVASADCLDNVWSKFSNVPPENSTDTLQGNQVIKEIIPQNSQLSQITSGKPDSKTREDTGVHTDLFHMNMIPNSMMPEKPKDRTTLFNKLMWPASQQQKK